MRHDKEEHRSSAEADGTSAADAYNTEFELIYAEAEKWDSAAAEAECGVPAADIERIAREYVQADKAMIIQNMGGFKAHGNGTNAVGTQLYPAALCGHVGHEGDGISDAGGVTEVRPIPIEVPKVEDPAPSIPRFKLGEAILNEKPAQGERSVPT